MFFKYRAFFLRENTFTSVCICHYLFCVSSDRLHKLHTRIPGGHFTLSTESNIRCLYTQLNAASISLICDKSVTTQNFVIFQENRLNVLKCCNFLWVERRHKCSPAASFCKLHYDNMPVKSATANGSFYTINSKMPNFELWHFCRKWAI
jgi:hypothetical protein